MQLVEGYTDVLYRQFQQHNKSCVLKFIKKKFNLHSKRKCPDFVYYSQCVFNNCGCKSYKFTIDGLIKKKQLTCRVYSNSVPICHPADETKRRHIRNWDRKNADKILLDHNKTWANVDENAVALDNLMDVSESIKVDSENSENKELSDVEDSSLSVEPQKSTEDSLKIYGRLKLALV